MNNTTSTLSINNNINITISLLIIGTLFSSVPLCFCLHCFIYFINYYINIYYGDFTDSFQDDSYFQYIGRYIFECLFGILSMPKLNKIIIITIDKQIENRIIDIV